MSEPLARDGPDPFPAGAAVATETAPGLEAVSLDSEAFESDLFPVEVAVVINAAPGRVTEAAMFRPESEPNDCKEEIEPSGHVPPPFIEPRRVISRLTKTSIVLRWTDSSSLFSGSMTSSVIASVAISAPKFGTLAVRDPRRVAVEDPMFRSE